MDRALRLIIGGLRDFDDSQKLKLLQAKKTQVFIKAIGATKKIIEL